MPDEVLITLRDFCLFFKRNLRHCQRRISAGKMPDATKVDGRWYVYVPPRALEAAKRRIELAA